MIQLLDYKNAHDLRYKTVSYSPSNPGNTYENQEEGNTVHRLKTDLPSYGVPSLIVRGGEEGRQKTVTVFELTRSQILIQNLKHNKPEMSLAELTH